VTATFYQGQEATLVLQTLEYSGGPAANVANLTITITPASGGAAAVGPTSSGIANPAVGVYTYTWGVPNDQDPGDYLTTWSADEGDSTELISVAEAADTTWATATEVFQITGETVTGPDLTKAQAMIELLIKRPFRAADASTKDYYWLKRAVSWQASFVKSNPDIANKLNWTSLTQDGFSVQFAANNSGNMDMTRYYSALAIQALNNLYQGANTSIRMRSGFRPRAASMGRGWRKM
jgi:hypothetical protein